MDLVSCYRGIARYSLSIISYHSPALTYRKPLKAPPPLKVFYTEGDFRYAGVELFTLQGRQIGGLEIVVIPGDVTAPLFRYRVFSKYGGYRADWLAGGAVDAFIRIDVVHIIFISGVDAVNRAHVYTRSILYPDTRFGNYIGHSKPLLQTYL
jgi:hypothetical protein